MPSWWCVADAWHNHPRLGGPSEDGLASRPGIGPRKPARWMISGFVPQCIAIAWATTAQHHPSGQMSIQRRMSAHAVADAVGHCCCPAGGAAARQLERCGTGWVGSAARDGAGRGRRGGHCLCGPADAATAARGGMALPVHLGGAECGVFRADCRGVYTRRRGTGLPPDAWRGADAGSDRRVGVDRRGSAAARVGRNRDDLRRRRNAGAAARRGGRGRGGSAWRWPTPW